MSLFKTITLACPACSTACAFEAVHSVNADRRPDFRDDILGDRFQDQTCRHCGTEFRLEPQFNYTDLARGQWISAAPLAALADWRAEEARAQALFDDAYGPDAGDRARATGRTLRPRLTFGWTGLREKLLAAEHGLDDLALELCKTVVLRSGLDAPVARDVDLRLVAVEADGGLIFGWQQASSGELGPTLRVERTLHDQIAADDSGDWDELRESIRGGLFVDLNRRLLAEA